MKNGRLITSILPSARPIRSTAPQKNEREDKSMTSSVRLNATMSLFVLILLSAWTPARAQDRTHGMYEQYGTIATEISGVSTFRVAPSDFNPTLATDQDLAMYGFPPRPDRTTNSPRYEAWAMHVNKAKLRWNGPLKVAKLENRGPSSMPASAVQQPNVIDRQYIFKNINWSGIANTKGIKKYSNIANSSASFRAVEAMFNVPVIEDAYGLSGCAAGAAGQVNMLVGIDGIVNQSGLSGSSLLAGGVLADNPGWINFGGCSVYPPTYNAEFFSPASASAVLGFSVNPGDTIFVEAWDTSSTTGAVYIVDDTTFAYATYELSWSYSILANSAEYIVIRLFDSDGSLSALGNYTGDFWTDAQAVDFNNHVYGPATNTDLTWLFEMTDDAGDQIISQPIPYMASLTTEGFAYGDSIYFYAENCAANYGCTP
jgi:Peptidase A4 family